jgi:hypothetical protein
MANRRPRSKARRAAWSARSWSPVARANIVAAQARNPCSGPSGSSASSLWARWYQPPATEKRRRAPKFTLRTIAVIAARRGWPSARNLPCARWRAACDSCGRPSQNATSARASRSSPVRPPRSSAAENRLKASCQRHSRTADRAEASTASTDRPAWTSSTVAGGPSTSAGAFEARGQSSSGSCWRIAAWSRPSAGLGSMPSCSSSVARRSAYARSASACRPHR